jgi:hypothetical protein
MNTATTDPVAHLSDEDLRKILEQRKEARKQAEFDRRQIQANKLLERVDAFLAITPDHNKTNCGDVNVANAWTDEHNQPRCLRCFLLEAKRTDYWNQDVEVKLVAVGLPDL